VHLLLSDVVMPGMSGPELWQQLRGTYPLRVLFMSGYADHAAIQNSGLGDDIPFIQKPFSQHSLLSKVRAVLGTAS
jgi:FixJ family two-component response regulator